MEYTFAYRTIDPEGQPQFERAFLFADYSEVVRFFSPPYTKLAEAINAPLDIKVTVADVAGTIVGATVHRRLGGHWHLYREIVKINCGVLQGADAEQLSLFKVWAFADWCADNYVRHNGWWVRPGGLKDEDNWKSTAELWMQFSENYIY
jgi:hypothetical protein